MIRWTHSLTVCLLVPVLGMVGCDSDDPATGTLSLEATDAPLPPDQVESALVEVTRITVHRQSDGDSGFVTIFDSAAPDVDPIQLELTELRNGVVEELAEAELEVGTYKQIRVFFTDGYLKLVNQNEYTTDDGKLQLTSQASSGLKVFPEPPIEITDGGHETICLDFDLSKTFLPSPADKPLEADSYKLGPVIRAANRRDTGDLEGTVSEDDGTGTLVGVEEATVHVLPEGETDLEQAVATTLTDADGSYAVLCLAEGTYDVVALKDTKEAREDAVDVTAGEITVVDLTIAEPPAGP